LRTCRMPRGLSLTGQYSRYDLDLPTRRAAACLAIGVCGTAAGGPVTPRSPRLAADRRADPLRRRRSGISGTAVRHPHGTSPRPPTTHVDRTDGGQRAGPSRISASPRRALISCWHACSMPYVLPSPPHSQRVDRLHDARRGFSAPSRQTLRGSPLIASWRLPLAQPCSRLASC